MGHGGVRIIDREDDWNDNGAWMSEETPDSAGSKPPCLREDALAVLLRLRQHGHVAYFAGGCVRDLLLGLAPKDWDVATDAPPQRVRELFSNTQAVGAAFGVILVKHGRSTVEVATFRREGAYCDGRRPDSVAFTDAREDAKRRDFTINGLFLDPERAEHPTSNVQLSTSKLVASEHGTVIDYVGGVDDLRSRTLRAIGEPEERFAEDHLRLLRAVRFAARFGLAVEAGTAGAIRRNAPKLKGIGPERIADELRGMLTAPTRAAAWRMLWEYALVDVIFRFLPSGEGVEFDPARSLFLSVSPERGISFGLALAAGVLDYRLQVKSAADVAALTSRQEVQRAAKALRDALRISNEELDEVVGILSPLPALLGDAEPSVAQKKRFLAKSTAGQTRELLAAVSGLGWYRERITGLESSFGELLSGEVAPAPLITGDDLAAAGLKPGPVFKRVLESVYDAQLEGRVTDRQGAMAMAMELARG
jgi:poly(A) polymerase